jgi:hypothetical protein
MPFPQIVAPPRYIAQVMESRFSILVNALAEYAGGQSWQRKLLVCHSYGEGRELLRVLAGAGGWVGFEATTPRKLALELVAVALAEEGLKVADEFDELALLDEAIDGTLESAPARLKELAQGVGLRQAIGETIRALRLAGVGPDALRRARLRDRDKRDALARVLSAYETALWRSRLADGATVFRRATAALDDGAAMPADRVFLLPGHGRRGVSGAFLDALVTRGALTLRGDPAVGLAPPAAWLRPGRLAEPAPVTRLAYLHAPDRAPAPDPENLAPDLFAAASVTDELREVLRRVMAAEVRWDEVEIVATEPEAYGAALDSLARRLEIPVTYAVGLPFERTRPGRALRGYLRWISEDFPDDVIRGLLMGGDLVLPDAGSPPGSSLARRLRRMQIGRGRERYAEALGRAERVLALPPSPEDDRSADEITQQRERERREVAGLAAMLRPVLAATPPVPGRLDPGELQVRPGELAAGALTLLRFVPSEAGIDAAAHARLTARLERLAETARRPTSLDAAIAILVARVETRVPAGEGAGGAPWGSAGGHLHLSDLAHGGLTGRPSTFIVGLDAGRFPGGGVQDAMLGDEDRQAVRTAAGASLATTAERLEEHRYQLAASLARLRGRVTLSYAAWEPAEARTVAPAAEMLQAFRLRTGNPAADYESLHTALAPHASPVPGTGARLDAADVWLGALAEGGGFRSGVTVVREAFRPLDRGLRALAGRKSRELTAYHGRIASRDALDPRRDPSIVVSASRLEWLGACPHRYFLRYVLGIRPPEDPALQPDRWLSPLNRGSLLHAVYERSLTLARQRGCATGDVAFDDVVCEVLDQEIAHWRELLPPPGRAVYEMEVTALRRDAEVFSGMVRDHGADWLALEHRFGRFGRDGSPPVELALPSGATIRVAGAIDRIDRRAEGLVVIDYKTGSPYEYDRKSGTYRGGRRLQHVLYRAIAEQLFGEPVIGAEYHFPTVRARNHIAAYDREDLAAGLTVVERLLELAAAGHFFPTDDPNDCRICDFQQVCRVRAADAGAPLSPPAEWTRAAAELEELRPLRELRGT